MMLLKRKRKWLIGLTALVCIGLGILYQNRRSTDRLYDVYGGVKDLTFETVMDDRYIFAYSNRGVSDLVLGNSYFVSKKGQVLNPELIKEESPVRNEEEERMDLYIYSLNGDLSSPRKLDIYSFLNIGEEGKYYRYRTGSVVYYGGRDYYLIKYYRVVNGEDQYHSVLLDLETEKEATTVTVDELEKRDVVVYNTYPLNLLVSYVQGHLTYDLSKKLLEDYGIELIKNGGLIRAGEDVDISGTNFAQLYPDIAKKFKTGSALYMRPSDLNEEEYFNNILYWFAPAGEETFEVYAEVYETKERTRITSYQEYQEWIQAHPKGE
ncbi:hypothetical protein ACTGZQ_02775 [Streptococcus suis]